MILSATSATGLRHHSAEHVCPWLDPDTTDKEKVQEMLDAIPEPVLTPRVVTDRVNSVRNNGPELIGPAP
jgi:putative SOS response-associated peptidase YedK